MPAPTNHPEMTFWEHLDIFRGALIKMGWVTAACAAVAFFFKETLFAVVLAPKNPGFVTYRWLQCLSGILPGDNNLHFSVRLINTGLAEQFVIHMKTALCAGILCASPYIIYQLFRFISPGLYENERKYAVSLTGCGYLMFGIGILVNYFLIFPLTFRFLGTYQVADDVDNMISLQSYMSTLVMMSLTMGIVFELPVLSWLLGRMGLISAGFMRRYRKHAIVVILTVAAIITPTSDVFTLLLVSIPMCLLYELSIRIVK
ncbi:MAG: twin-arginine translocase subunit TatC [Clostridium sp.]|nr:twin-arginine translocase subunit TatC [Clostridium sp.]